MIKNACLFEHLRFASNALQMLKQVVKIFHKDEYMGKQVTRFEIFFCKQPDMYTMFTLPRLTPNMKSLKWTCHGSENNLSVQPWQKPDDDICFDAFKYWNKLEDLKLTVNAVRFGMEPYLLQGAELSHLKRLEIEMVDVNLDRSEASRIAQFVIRIMQNLPSPNLLSLKGFTLNLQNLESVHKNAPNLAILELNEIALDTLMDHSTVVSSDCRRLVYKDSGKDMVITPVKQLSSLTFTLMGNGMMNIFINC